MKKNVKILVMIFVILLTMFMLKTVSKAASFGASISATEVKVGDTVKVTVSANNAAGMYSVITNNSNLSKTSGDTSEFLENGSTTITYKAEKAGTTTITAKATDMTDLDDDTKKVTGSKTFTVTVKSNETTNNNTNTDKNTNADKNTNTNTNNNANTNNNTNNTPTEPKKGTVSSCYINGIKVNEFLNVKNKDSVSIKVNTSTGEGLKIYNNKTDKTYTVKSGATTNVKIVEGTQTLTITLNTGYKTTRKIISTKEGEEVLPNQIEETVKPLLKSLKIKEFAITPEFSSEVYEYNLTIPEEQNDVTSLNIEAIAASEEFIVQINGNKDLVDGENIVNILVKSKDGTAVTTYKLIVNKEPKKEVETVATSAPIIEETPMEVTKTINMPRLLIVIFTAIIAIAGVVFAVMEYNYHKNKAKDGEVKIPFAKVGYENEETQKEDVLEEVREEEFKQDKNKEIANNNEEEFEQLQEEPKTRKKGKHF